MRVTGAAFFVSTWPDARVIARIGAHHYAAAFDPVRPRLFTAGRDGVHAWDLASMPASGPLRWVRMNESKLVAGGNYWNRCTMSPDGRWLAAVSGKARRWKTGKSRSSTPARWKKSPPFHGPAPASSLWSSIPRAAGLRRHGGVVTGSRHGKRTHGNRSRGAPPKSNP